ncbi:MAG: amidohydrolase [Clostridia bacterium]|nr:amidohydrolase [Clostridia bacterium]
MFEKYINEVDRKSAEIFGVSDGIWDHAEIAFAERVSSGLLADALEKEGFTVTRGLAGIPTAFKAVYGASRPVMGILAEFDALQGINQAAGATEQKTIPGPDVGHGCGHNLFAGGSFGAALAVKAYLEDHPEKGSVVLFGCPGEENGAGKVYMARAGVFNGVDAVVSWHPEKMYMVRTRPSLALVTVKYSFRGIAAHAGGSPHLGRSALDAAELMNVGVNFLREHMELTSRIHYAFLDAGGEAPNVVQSHAVVRYIVRASTLKEVLKLRARVDDIARGAALMTGTTVSWQQENGYSELITVPAMQQTAYEAMQDVPLPMPTEEENAFGRALQKTMPLDELPETVYAEKLLPPAPPKPHGGSTDTADVSWICPTVQMHIGTWAIGTPGHSWQAVSQGKSSYAHKATLYAAKSVAGTVLRLFEDPARLEKAKEEHREKTKGGYVCPIPDDILPNVPQA